jgi:hypothetical protein
MTLRPCSACLTPRTVRDGQVEVHQEPGSAQICPGSRKPPGPRDPEPGEDWLLARCPKWTRKAHACCFCGRPVGGPGSAPYGIAVFRGEHAHYACAPGLGVPVTAGMEVPVTAGMEG